MKLCLYMHSPQSFTSIYTLPNFCLVCKLVDSHVKNSYEAPRVELVDLVNINRGLRANKNRVKHKLEICPITVFGPSKISL